MTNRGENQPSYFFGNNPASPLPQRESKQQRQSLVGQSAALTAKIQVGRRSSLEHKTTTRSTSRQHNAVAIHLDGAGAGASGRSMGSLTARRRTSNAVAPANVTSDENKSRRDSRCTNQFCRVLRSARTKRMMVVLMICALLTLLSVLLNVQSLSKQVEDMQHSPFLHKGQNGLKETSNAPSNFRRDTRTGNPNQEQQQQRHGDNTGSSVDGGGSRVDARPPQPKPTTVDEKVLAAKIEKEKREQQLLEQRHAEERRGQAEVLHHFEQLDGQNCRPSGELVHHSEVSSVVARKLCMARADCECVACDMDTIGAGCHLVEGIDAVVDDPRYTSFRKLRPNTPTTVGQTEPAQPITRDYTPSTVSETVKFWWEKVAEQVDSEVQWLNRQALADKVKASLPKLEEVEEADVPTAGSWKSEYKKKPAWWDRYVEQERLSRERAANGEDDYDYSADDETTEQEYYDDEFYNVEPPKNDNGLAKTPKGMVPEKCLKAMESNCGAKAMAASTKPSTRVACRSCLHKIVEDLKGDKDCRARHFSAFCDSYPILAKPT